MSRGEGRIVGLANYTKALLYNGLGRYDEALAAARRCCEHEDLGVFGFCLIELVEAAARGGAPDGGRAALRQLEERALVTETDWAAGVLAWSRALLADDQSAEAHYQEAIDRLQHTRIAVQLARAHLVYGEWLRRCNRRIDARAQLQTAHEMFGRMGADAFAARSARAAGHRPEGQQALGRAGS